ncbi:MAG: DnaD domain protein [Lachnospiraceae bacterium]|nr:DnaD domain protein [Lachnospiraceae bacterium]
MSPVLLTSNHSSCYTQVGNEFIDHFMTDANDVQIKVYLYLLRHLPVEGCFEISAMADLFNYPEKDILRALFYWDKKGVLSLTLDEKDNITQVLLKDFKAQAQPSAKAPVPIVKTVTYLPSKKDFTKPDYSLDQVAEFSTRETTSEILFIAESYLGKTLSANDIRSLLFISDHLRFSVDMIDHLLQYCIDRGKKDFRYIEKVAINWAENNISTPSQAEDFSSKYNKEVYTVMNALGKNNLPTAKETEFIKRWYQIYGFTSDVVLEACQRTVLATDRHRFEYADKILTSWKNAGVHHKPDIDKIDADFTAAQRKPVSSSPSKNKFNQFQQNNYDFDSLEKELLSN